MAVYTWPVRSYIVGVSNFDWSPVSISNAQLDAWSKGVVSEIAIETGREKSYFTSLDGDSLSADCATEVWQMMMEQRYIKRRDDVMESEYDDTYQSMSVTGYSETKPAHQSASRSRNSPIFSHLINSSPEIARKLWYLMTDTRRSEIRGLNGEVVPMEYVQETDWFAPADNLYPQRGGWWF